MTSRLRKGARWMRWYLRQVTGEGKWDEYVAACASAGTEPMSRREFERHRDHEREGAARGRCC